MRNTGKCVALTTALLVGGCGSDNPIAIDPNVAAQIDNLNQCFPGLYEKLDAILDVAKLWNLNGSNPPDPAGVSSTIVSPSRLDIRYDIPGTSCRIDFQVHFYQENGASASPNFGGAPSLSQRLDDAATDLRNQFPNTKPFAVAAYQASGTTAGGETLGGAGNLTGRIGGATNQNELEVLRTTALTPTGGEPANADATLTLTGPSRTCTLTFNTDPLMTDTVTDQQYPIGTLTFTLTDGTTTTTGSVKFDNTNEAEIRITGVGGVFKLNLDTFTLTYIL